MEDIEELGSSELGTKEHWDTAYEEELENFKKHGIVGDVWFGEDIMMRIVRYITDNCVEITPASKIADLGCGGGHLLLELGREGYTKLTGLDYSQPGLDLAAAVLSGDNIHAEFKKFDLLEEHEESTLDKYDVCLDKGTFDAISLCPSVPQAEARKKYFQNVKKLMKDEGIFILTSCNWTAKELVAFSSECFNFFGIIPTPQFTFGGRTGNVVSIVILRKKLT